MNATPAFSGRRRTPGEVDAGSAATSSQVRVDLIDGLTVEVRAGHGLVAGARERSRPKIDAAWRRADEAGVITIIDHDAVQPNGIRARPRSRRPPASTARAGQIEVHLRARGECRSGNWQLVASWGFIPARAGQPLPTRIHPASQARLVAPPRGATAVYRGSTKTRDLGVRSL